MLNKKLLLPGEAKGNEISRIGEESNGFARLRADVALDCIKEHLENATSSTPNSIPKTTAYLYYMKSQVSDNNEDENLRKWEGILAIIGLSKIYGFNVTMKPAFTEISSVVKNILEEDLKEELRVEDLKSEVAIIEKDNIPIAITHKEVLICPFCEIDPSAFHDVPWFKSGVWEKPEKYLETPEKTKLRAWLQKLNLDLEAMKNFVKRLTIDGIETNIGATDKIRYIDSTSTTATHSFDNVKLATNSNNAFINVPRLPIDMGEIFNDMLAIVAISSNARLGNEFCLSFQCDDLQEPEYYGVLLPFTKKFIQLMEQKRDVEDQAKKLVVERVSVEKEDESSKIIVTVYLNNGGIPLRRHKEYYKENIRLIKDFPYITLWPYVDLPQDRWREYIIAIKQKEERNVRARFVQGMNKIEGNSIKIDPVIGGNGIFNCKVEAIDSKNYSWYINRMNKMPWAINFEANEFGNEINLGAIFIAKSNVGCREGNFTKNVTIALDFGTTNTLCEIYDGVTEQLQLNALEYSLDITECEESEKAAFEQKYWMEKKILKEKIPSISQLYAGAAMGSIPYQDGRLFINDVQTLIDFCQDNSDDKNQDLQNKGIFNNLKFYGVSNPNVISAAKIFLKTILAFAVLQAKIGGADQFQINVSYPREEVKNDFANYEDEITGYLRTYCCCGVVNFIYNTEAEAAALYFQTRPLTQVPDSQAGYAIIDIGGGTSDISLWKNNESGKIENKGVVSLLYAGRRIIIRSIYETFKVFPDQFSHIWNSEIMNNTINQEQISKEEIRDLESQLRKWHKQIRREGNRIEDFSPASYNSICNLIETLIEKIGLNTAIFNQVNPNLENFQSLLVGMIRIKFTNLFYILANFIKETKAINTELGIFKIYLAGGATKALKFCNNDQEISAGQITSYKNGFGCYLIQMVTKILEVEENDVNIISPMPGMEKKEVVLGLAMTDLDKEKIAVTSYETTVLKWSSELDQLLQQRYETYVNTYLLNTDKMLIKNLKVRISLENEEVKKKYKSLKKGIYDIVYNEKSQYPDLIKKDIFVAFMVENLLNMSLVDNIGE